MRHDERDDEGSLPDSVHEADMKGRRKVRTSRWFLKAQFEAEAQRMMAHRSKKAAHRFLDAASQIIAYGALRVPVV